MRQDAVPGLRLGLRDRLVGLRQLLEIVDAGNQRVDIGLRDADPQRVQNDLGTLGIVLVPTVVQRRSASLQVVSHRGTQRHHLMEGGLQPPLTPLGPRQHDARRVRPQIHAGKAGRLRPETKPRTLP
jgi:hypothetical protein